MELPYTKKDVWASFERYAREVDADMVFMDEPPVNSGHFYAVPNARVLALIEEWMESQSTSTGQGDQHSLNQMRNKTYIVCSTKQECDEAKKKKMTFIQNKTLLKYRTRVPNIVTMRLHVPLIVKLGLHVCPPPDNSHLDPCAADFLYIHTICVYSVAKKIQKLKTLGFWLLHEPCHASQVTLSSAALNVSVIRCSPRILTLPLAEEKFMRCNRSLAWT